MLAVPLFFLLIQPPASVARAQQDLAAGRVSEAIVLFTELLKASPRDAELLTGLGIAQQTAGDYPSAIENLRKALQLDSGRAAAWYALGRSWGALGSESYQQLLRQVSADSAYALAVDADALMRHQQYKRAFALFQRALTKDANLVSVRSAMGEIYRLNGHADWAAQEEAMLAGIDCSTHALACDSLKGNYEALLRAVQNQDGADACYWRGEAFTGLSYQAFTRLLQLPPSAEMFRFKAGLEYEAGHRKQVVEELRRAIALAPRDRGLQVDLAMALGSSGNLAEAFTLASKLLRSDPHSAELNALAGDALLNQQRAQEAISFFRRSLAANPRNLMTHDSLGRAYLEAGQPRLALAELEAALPMDRDGSVEYSLAVAYREIGRPELAARAMTKYHDLSVKAAVPPEPEITAPQ